MKKICLVLLAAILCVVIGCAAVAMAEEHTHIYGEWNVKTEATCDAEGLKVRMCEDCGNVESEAIPKTAHIYGEWNVKTEPTYDAEGEKVRMCEDCGNVESEAIPALEPTAKPTTKPTEQPTTKPTVKPSDDVEDNDVPKTADNGISYVVIISAMVLSIAYLVSRRFSREK